MSSGPHTLVDALSTAYAYLDEAFAFVDDMTDREQTLLTEAIVSIQTVLDNKRVQD